MKYWAQAFTGVVVAVTFGAFSALAVPAMAPPAHEALVPSATSSEIKTVLASSPQSVPSAGEISTSLDPGKIKIVPSAYSNVDVVFAPGLGKETPPPKPSKGDPSNGNWGSYSDCRYSVAGHGPDGNIIIYDAVIEGCDSI